MTVYPYYNKKLFLAIEKQYFYLACIHAYILSGVKVQIFIIWKIIVEFQNKFKGGVKNEKNTNGLHERRNEQRSSIS